jgi:hypothetical protein
MILPTTEELDYIDKLKTFLNIEPPVGVNLVVWRDGIEVCRYSNKNSGELDFIKTDKIMTPDIIDVPDYEPLEEDEIHERLLVK